MFSFLIFSFGCDKPRETSSLEGNWKTGPSKSIPYQPRKVLDGSGYGWVMSAVKPWPQDSTLEQIGEQFRIAVRSSIASLDQILSDPNLSSDEIASSRYSRSTFHNYDGDPIKAYEDLCKAREYMEKNPRIAKDFLYTIIYNQGITAMRRGENENCIACRGESSCILPISKSAVHQNPEGSRIAIKHFMEYLEKFPDDGEVRWLLNVAYMTLDEHPQKVPSIYLIDIDRYAHEEHGIGRFRDIGEAVGLNRFNQAGGAIMDDFDGDGRLDVVISSFDPTQIMGVYRNENLQKFLDVTVAAGVSNQLGGLNCVQTDYNNDGWLDVFIVRGAWLTPTLAMRPSLLRNNVNMTFTDVTTQAGLGDALNSISATWADFDRDGGLDVFVCSDQQSNRLYRNKHDGTFENVAVQAGVAGGEGMVCKGAAWIDIENDGWPDLFMNHLSRVGAQLWKNRRDGTFENVTRALGIDGPQMGFSCWAWDFNNDGWQDIFATNYSRSVGACVQGMIGQEHTEAKSCLYLNQEGKRFINVTKDAGLEGVYITMGSNFADFDNDGWLDFYLGTGDPNLGTLVPNRMFRNLGGKRFVDITASSGTGNLQKGHGVACGDWDRNGSIDLFIEMGGAVNGDKYHNILFQNPGNQNSWTSLKLIGKSSNIVAIGAKIKIHTDDPNLPYVFRHVTSGSSFGANPLEQTIGLGKATTILGIEIQWPMPADAQDIPSTEKIDGPIPLGKTLRIEEGQGLLTQ
ncbi:MAG: CRTAC1 family protein [Planctomycetota bacterium]